MKQLHAQLTHLTWQAERIAGGDYKQRVDFMGDFSAAFNKMVDQLAQREKSLRDARRQLQEKVRDRTAELAEANKLLKQDIARRKKAEKDLIISNRNLGEMMKHSKILAEEAMEASRAKSQFLANMSHELRTPMNAVIGFAGVLAEEPLTDTQKQYIDMISSSGSHLLRIIEDILDFARIEAGKICIESEECSIKHILDKVESMMRPAAEEKGLEFGIRTKSGLPENIITDPGRLQQCLINLINNAVKFTEAGYVYLNVASEKRDDRPFIRFSVEDTGIGIPDKVREKIFSAFAQADESHTRKYGGTGLGLPITKQLAELLGGEVDLSSRQGKGSVFSIVIPLDDNASQVTVG